MPSKRGFAAMDPAKQKEIASKGGKAAHNEGTAHEFSPDEARAAGKKGGESVSRNREHMAAIGRKGGVARGAARRSQAQVRGERPEPESGDVSPTAVLDETRDDEEGGAPGDT